MKSPLRVPAGPRDSPARATVDVEKDPLLGHRDLAQNEAQGRCHGFFRSRLFVALLVSLIVVTVVVTLLVVFLSKADGPEELQQHPFTLKDYLSGDFRARSFSGSWHTETAGWEASSPSGAIAPAGALLSWLTAERDVLALDPLTGEERVLLNHTAVRWSSSPAAASAAATAAADPTLTLTLAAPEVDDNGFLVYSKAWLSPDLSFALLATDVEPVYRHSFLAHYFLYELASHQLFALSDPALGKLQLAVWSPAGDSVAYVRDNNVYVARNVPQPLASTVAVTDTGRRNEVINGVPSWLYEEEIYATNSALWWAPDGRSLAFAEFNVSAVPSVEWPWYFEDPADQYTTLARYNYPKPGRTNPRASLRVWDAERAAPLSSRVLLGADGGANGLWDEFYLSEVVWADGRQCGVRVMNRAQNESSLLLCDAAAATRDDVEARARPCNASDAISHLRAPGAWLDRFGALTFFNANHGGGGDDDGSLRYVDIVSVGGAPRLALFSLNKTEPLRILSSEEAEGEGPFAVQEEVTAVNAVSAAAGFVVYTSTRCGDACLSPEQRHVWSASLDDATPGRGRRCLTCNGTGTDSDPSGGGGGEHGRRPVEGYFSAQVSPAAVWAVLRYSGPQVPRASLLHLPSGNITLVLEDNAALRARIADAHLALPSRHVVRVPLNELNTTMLCALTLPADLSLDSLRHGHHHEHHNGFPLLFDVYGGPGSQKVTAQWSLSWSTYLATSMNVLVASCDGRGTGARGDAWRHTVYRRLGDFEAADQIRAAEHLTATFGGVRRQRGVAVWGWSYGGYLTTKILERGAHMFQAGGMAVAPVTDWRLYDSAYTERFMGLLDSAVGEAEYARASTVFEVERLRALDGRYLLVHGTADDNVLFENAAVLVSHLTRHQVKYQFQMYTDRAHDLSGGGTSESLYQLLTDFLGASMSQPVRHAEL